MLGHGEQKSMPECTICQDLLPNEWIHRSCLMSTMQNNWWWWWNSVGNVFLTHTRPLNTDWALVECYSIVLSTVSDHLIMVTFSMKMYHVTHLKWVRWILQGVLQWPLQSHNENLGCSRIENPQADKSAAVMWHQHGPESMPWRFDAVLGVWGS